jgi:hypothetical protein
MSEPSQPRRFFVSPGFTPENLIRTRTLPPDLAEGLPFRRSEGLRRQALAVVEIARIYFMKAISFSGEALTNSLIFERDQT